jgi:hypothetical protein
LASTSKTKSKRYGLKVIGYSYWNTTHNTNTEWKKMQYKNSVLHGLNNQIILQRYVILSTISHRLLTSSFLVHHSTNLFCNMLLPLVLCTFCYLHSPKVCYPLHYFPPLAHILFPCSSLHKPLLQYVAATCTVYILLLTFPLLLPLYSRSCFSSHNILFPLT